MPAGAAHGSWFDWLTRFTTNGVIPNLQSSCNLSGGGQEKFQNRSRFLLFPHAGKKGSCSEGGGAGMLPVPGTWRLRRHERRTRSCPANAGCSEMMVQGGATEHGKLQVSGKAGIAHFKREPGGVTNTWNRLPRQRWGLARACKWPTWWSSVQSVTERHNWNVTWCMPCPSVAMRRNWCCISSS